MMDPKPSRKRGRLPTIYQLGGRCQVCGWEPLDHQLSPPFLERMHLLRGVHKEDDLDLIMLGCGDFGRCRVHPRLDREADPTARVQVRAAMTPEQRMAIITRRGQAWLDDHYPKEEADAA